jgi:uncharacterized protein YbjT (DUF2867 family)
MAQEPNADRLILVSGATGRQGGAVARHLLRRGFRVRALTRDPSKPAAGALLERGAQLAEGDFDDHASIVHALEGCYGAFSVQNFWEVGKDAEIRQGCAFADLAKAAGVRHLVYSSVGSAHRGTGIPHFESKWQVEEHIRAIGVPHTILRPVFFMQNWETMRDAILGGQLPQPLSPGKRLQQVSVEDIGAFAALAFERPEDWLGRAFDLAGDEPTMRETAAAFERVLGRAVQYVQVPWDAFRAQFGEEVAAMYRWFEDVGYEADIAAARAAYPETATLERYLHEAGWAEAASPFGG